jgi:SpoVK/Ycf46/Vps4 family AAA+-type ATPase
VLKHLIQKGVKQEDNAGEIVFIAINSGVKELLAEVLNIENVDRTYINKSLTRIKQIDELMLRQNLLNITPHSQQEKIQEMIEILNIKFEQEEFKKVFTKGLKNESKKTRIKI